MNNKLPFGLKDDLLVHVSEVDRGLACGCICPGCGEKLIARKGGKTTHHFAHAKGGVCATGFETALHLAAKDILAKTKEIMLPCINFYFPGNKKPWLLSKAKPIQLDEVVLEKKLGEIVPDVIAYANGIPLLIEFFVTHPVDDEKLSKIKELGVSALEVDLSKHARNLNREALQTALCHEIRNKRWLFNRRVEKFRARVKKCGDEKILRYCLGTLRVDDCPLQPDGLYCHINLNNCKSCNHCLHIWENDRFPHIRVQCAGKLKIESLGQFKHWEQNRT